MSAVKQSQKEQTEGEKESPYTSIWREYTLRPLVVFLALTQFFLPVESAMSHCSLWLTPHPDHPADYICPADLCAKETDRKKKDIACFREKKDFLGYPAPTSSHCVWECRGFCVTEPSLLSVVIILFLCLWVYTCESQCMCHTFPPLPFFASGVVSDISVQTMKL